MPTEKGRKEFAETLRVLLNLKNALIEVDSQVIWEMFSAKTWRNPDADVCNMVGNIDGFLKDNEDWLN